MTIDRFGLGSNGPYTYRVTDPTWPSIQVVWDGKDDANLLTKIKVMTRYTALGAGFFSLIDINMWPRTDPGIATALSRVKFWSVPIVGSGLAYVSMVHLSSTIRKKTDERNHFYGGLAVGAVLGKCSRCFITGCVTGLIFGLIGSMCKEGAIAGVGPTWTLNKNSRVAGPLSHEYDFTLKKNYPGYWVRTPEEIPAAVERGQLGGPY